MLTPISHDENYYVLRLGRLTVMVDDLMTQRGEALEKLKALTDEKDTLTARVTELEEIVASIADDSDDEFNDDEDETDE